MKKFIEGSHAVAEAVKICCPGVISAYPITPQTHIVERLADFVANGELSSQFVNVESEHSAASVVLGSSMVGVRTFTATSSQGLILMSEVLFNIAGMRLPIVMVCANRALSAPINIWNDHQDAITLRDSGWLQLFAENNQEAHDFIFQAYKIAENAKVMLPIMVNMDGFILTHGMEVVDLAEKEKIDTFLQQYAAPYKLDVDNPMSFGLLGDPSIYTETRIALHRTLEETLSVIPQVGKEYTSLVGNGGIDLIEEYNCDTSDTIIVAMGSVCGTIKDYIDQKVGESLGLARIISYRPFPKERLNAVLKGKKVVVLEKAISLGADGPLFTEICSLPDVDAKATYGFVGGLGGRDITFSTCDEIMEVVKNKDQERCHFLNVDPSLLKEEFYV